MDVCVVGGCQNQKEFLSSGSLDGVGLSKGSLCVGYRWEVLAPKIDKELCQREPT